MQIELRHQIDGVYREGVALLMGALTEPIAAQGPAATPIAASYQGWYSKALGIVWRLLPERYAEFQNLYSGEGRSQLDAHTYAISDFFLSVPLPGYGANEPRSLFASKFHLQLAIFASARDRIDARFVELERALELRFLDAQLQAAIHLFAQRQLRAAGAVAYLVLRAALRLGCQQAGVPAENRDSTAAELNDALQRARVTNDANWHFIHRLCSLSAQCLDGAARDPTAGEIEELITGARHVQNLFA